VIGDSGVRVQLIWVIEKDHSPAEFGTLASAEGRLSPATPLLTAQATAFIRSYLAPAPAPSCGSGG
jgi:hypothetical protein